MGLYLYRHVIANERTSFWFVHRLRWPRGVRCPDCGSSTIYTMREGALPRYRCKVCARHFSVRTGTLLEGSRLPLTKWVLAIGLLRVGISARALARELAVSRQTAWELLHRLREALRGDVFARKLRGRIEVDETYIGGRHKGKRGRGAAHKSVVIGLKVREGRVRSLLIPSVSTSEIHRVLKAHVAKGARLYTDEFSSYRKVRRIGYRHRRVAHSRRFVRGQTHTQSIEGHWGHIKPTLVARHRAVSPKHLQRYLIEADFKHRLPEEIDFIALVFNRLLATQPALPNH